MNEIYPFEKEKKLIKLFSFDFGNLGTEFIKQRLKIIGINALYEVNEEVQLKIVFDLCYELYSEILSKESLMKKIKIILLSSFDKYEVYSFLFWRENFIHDSIEFLYHFFGKDISELLIKIHIQKNKINNIKDKDEIQKFNFVNTLINELTKENLSFRKSLNSNFTKYLIYGESKSLKLRGFLKIRDNKEDINFLSNLKNYISFNIDKKNDKKFVEVIDLLEDIIDEKKIFNEIQSNFKKEIDMNQIKNMISRYIGENESNKILKNGLNEFSIRNINQTNNLIKRNFVNYIIEKSEISSYSKQKQKIIKTLLFMLLKL
ncbi:MAG: hypothetical protein ACMXX8_03815 [Candidatus Woesearchaeota archaeon]